MSSAELSRRDYTVVLAFATCARLLVCLYLYALPQLLAPFDASAQVLLGRSQHPLEGFLRWDTLHFARLALRGDYEMEKDYAFLPGIWQVMRHSGRLVAWLRGGHLGASDVVLGGTICANIASIASAVVLLRLTYRLTRDRRLALTAAMLFCIPPAPQILCVPYTEPFYALYSFSGMLLVSEGRVELGTATFALASCFRANGFLNAGFIIWHLLLQPWSASALRPSILLARLARASLYSVVIALPFLLVQRDAYRRFCLLVKSRPWCLRRLPLVYPFVQEHYWDVGFLRYWTAQQSPLFLLSAPVLALSFAASFAHYRRSLKRALSLCLPFLFVPHHQDGAGFHSAALLPYIHLHTALTLVLFFASHVQICLRQASTDPVVFWYAAHLFLQGDRRWPKYCVIWGAIALVMWSGFYPPA